MLAAGLALAAQLADLGSRGLSRMIETRLAEEAPALELQGYESWTGPVGGAANAEALALAASQAGATHTLVSSLTRIGQGLSLDLTLWETSLGRSLWSGYAEGADLDAIRTALPELVARAARALSAKGSVDEEVARTPAPVSTSPATEAPSDLAPPPAAPTTQLAASDPGAPRYPRTLSIELEAAVQGLELCELDAEPGLELVTVEDDALLVHTLEGESVQLLHEFEAGFFDRFIGVDCLDVDEDGRAEVALTVRRHGAFRSQVLEWDGDGLSGSSAELPYALRAVPTEPKARRLHAQRFPDPGRLYGPVYEVVRVDAGYGTADQAVVLPRDANLGALALGAATGADASAALTIDAKGSLLLYRGLVRVWSAEGQYGGYDLAFEYRGSSNPMSESDLELHLRDRIEVADTAPSPTLIVSHIESPLGNLFPRLNLGKELTLAGFRWDGQTLRQTALPFGYSPESHADGEIVDYRVIDATGDGTQDLVVAVVDDHGGWLVFGSPKSRILIFPGAPSPEASVAAP